MTDHKPVIGISGWKVDSKSVKAMCQKVIDDGGIPMVFCNHANRNPRADIEKIDALIVMGNDWDIDPNKYVDRYPEGDPRREVHPESTKANQMNDSLARARAAYEEQMLALALRKNMPILGICGGMQQVNVMQGGGLLQHMPDLLAGNTMHSANDGNPMVCPVIPIQIDPQSALGAVAAGTNVSSLYAPSVPPAPGRQLEGAEVNSYHHQAVDPDLLGQGLRVVAFSDDYKNVWGERRQFVEGIEFIDPNKKFIGLQFHPEFLKNEIAINVVKTTVDRGAEYQKTSQRDFSADQRVANQEYIMSEQQGKSLPVQTNPVVTPQSYTLPPDMRLPGTLTPVR